MSELLDGMLPPLKGYQEFGADQVDALCSHGAKEFGRSVLVVAPPGAGKSRVMIEGAWRELQRGGRLGIMIHRRMLLKQLEDQFDRLGFDYGCISPDHEMNLEAPIQLMSAQTLYSRAVQRGSIDFPDLTKVFVDEAHQQARGSARSILFGSSDGSYIQNGFLSRGVDVVGFTATPVMRERFYMDMVELATYTQLREERMHQPIKVFGPDEIDTAGLKQNASGEFSEKKVEERVRQAVIFGSVYDHWRLYNPDGLPSILFGPSVEGAKWFAHGFASKGVPVAHIDAESVLLPGPNGRLKTYAATNDARQDVLAMSRSGEVKLVTNRFILREAIDMPWLYHGIFATVIGSITSGLQSVGRLQRFWEPYEALGGFKIMQDHGGFYWRHGSPNEDRDWMLGDNVISYSRKRIQKIQKGKKLEGMCCPECGCWRIGGRICPNCGRTSSYSVRRVRQLSGKLKEVKGYQYQGTTGKQRRTQAERLWVSMLYRGYHEGRTVRQVKAMAVTEASRRGLYLDFSAIRHAPPEATNARIDMNVGMVYPWVAKSAQRRGGRSKRPAGHSLDTPW